jgi:16S rRNA (guanine527-N7)-methyltransferase
MELILKYFPGLTESQIRQFKLLGELYPEWNDKVNIISRKDIENLYERHILHSLSIAAITQFKTGTSIVDAGTGGGFPGIPLAIIFPGSHFHLVDSTGKKLVAVRGISDAIGLANVTSAKVRLEELKETYDFAVSRSVATLPQMVRWLRKNIRKESGNSLQNGILYLKGGDFSAELKQIHLPYKVYEIKDFFEEEFFITKKIVHISCNS